MALTQSISLEVIIRTVFGVASPAEVDAYKATILAAIESASPLVFFFPWLRHEFGGIGPFARLKAAQGRFIALLRRQIAAVRPRAAEREDILSMMLEARYDDGAPMPDAAIVDELRTLLLAGHETTALSLAWALDLVHRDRAVYERLVAELDGLGPAPSPEAIAAAPFLEAVCQETLRLYPIVLEVMRTLTRPLTLAGRDLPAGATVTVNILLAHRRPEAYPDPEVFRPQRFLERTYSPFEFMPFGGGPRRCLGAAFALFEMKLVLATILREVALELEDPGLPTPVRRNLTMAPKGGVRMRVRQRRGASARGAAVAP
jgi:cytochrome P450